MTSRQKTKADLAKRITREIEEVVTSSGYPGQGILGALGFDHGTLFIELPYALQWKELNERVNWSGLLPAEKDHIVARVLADVREKIPEEIYPATWFDGLLLSGIAESAKVYDLGTVRNQFDTPDRNLNLDERVCAPERVQRRKEQRTKGPESGQKLR